MRFPPGRQGKQVPVRIGPYGKGLGKWALKEAREEWDRIRVVLPCFRVLRFRGSMGRDRSAKVSAVGRRANLTAVVA